MVEAEAALERVHFLAQASLGRICVLLKLRWDGSVSSPKQLIATKARAGLLGLILPRKNLIPNHSKEVLTISTIETSKHLSTATKHKPLSNHEVLFFRRKPCVALRC